MTIEIPEDLASLFQEPEKVKNAFAMLKALRDLNVQLVTPQSSVALVPGKKNIVGEPPILLLPLPLKMTQPIEDSDGVDGNTTTQLNLLLGELRKIGILPTD